MGDIQIELNAEKAPRTVASFLQHVDASHYDNLIFHRAIAGFMIQTGGYHEDMSEAAEGDTVRNEADNGLMNVKGSLAMARMNEIDSARMQFFINVSDNSHLDHAEDSCSREDEAVIAQAAARGLYKPQTCQSFGYAVFGAVIEGMDVVEEIELVDTGLKAGHQDVPLEPVFITSIERIDPISPDEIEETDQ
jgi:cyclophilin family peptidyl-prolyl cis-trans isomerase